MTCSTLIFDAQLSPFANRVYLIFLYSARSPCISISFLKLRVFFGILLLIMHFPFLVPLSLLPFTECSNSKTWIVTKRQLHKIKVKFLSENHYCNNLLSSKTFLFVSIEIYLTRNCIPNMNRLQDTFADVSCFCYYNFNF